jgi:hypothetical protein
VPVIGVAIAAVQSDYLYCLILQETSESEYIIERVTTKIMNVNEIIVYFY